MDLASLLAIPSLHLRPPIDPLLAAAPSLLLLVLFLLPPSRFLSAALLPPLLLLALYPPLAYTTGDPGADFALASTNFQRCLIALDRFLFTDNLETTFIKPGQTGAPKGWRRIWWAVENTMLQRGVGTKWEVRNVPKGGRKLSRVNFTITRLGRAIVAFLVFDIVSAYMQRGDYFKQRVQFVDLPFAERQFNSVCVGIASSVAMFILYDVICAVSVGLGVWSPEESADLFGSPRVLTSLRNFWGSFWHQCFRRVFESPVHFLLTSLSLPRSSLPANLLALFIPFTLSALQHAYAVYAMNRTGLRTFLFFFIQPVGLIAEALVQRMAKGLGVEMESSMARMAGTCWMVTWLLWAGPLFFDDLVQAGMWEKKPPFNLTEGLLSGNWANK
ncbi:membrane bound O-acyl transferase family-domain-containing protein [Leucosporidium creatinivorum]|uniref:Membrane bound O-acyl transferase family-domain-containing protein n=1 Tax=Leucosporidium creatinivorum TaxID=106004 RepID=A0A1Y2ERZ4_9BASI|nr:membrane bound O-acyl transferase family-domain-containing protein [Leucosporidium creatinivorum]